MDAQHVREHERGATITMPNQNKAKPNENLENKTTHFPYFVFLKSISRAYYCRVTPRAPGAVFTSSASVREPPLLLLLPFLRLLLLTDSPFRMFRGRTSNKHSMKRKMTNPHCEVRHKKAQEPLFPLCFVSLSASACLQTTGHPSRGAESRSGCG